MPHLKLGAGPCCLCCRQFTGTGGCTGASPCISGKLLLQGNVVGEGEKCWLVCHLNENGDREVFPGCSAGGKVLCSCTCCDFFFFFPPVSQHGYLAIDLMLYFSCHSHLKERYCCALLTCSLSDAEAAAALHVGTPLQLSPPGRDSRREVVALGGPVVSFLSRGLGRGGTKLNVGAGCHFLSPSCSTCQAWQRAA